MKLGKIFGCAMISGGAVLGAGPIIEFYRFFPPSIMRVAESRPAITRYERVEAAHDLRIPGMDNMSSAKARNCALIPATEKSFLTHEWVIDCNAPYSDSGQHLIKEFSRKEAERHFGVERAAKPEPDRSIFSFTG